MLVERSGKVDIEQVLMEDRQCHHSSTEVEVAQVIWVDIRVTVWLESGAISRLDEQCIVWIEHLCR